MSTYLSSLTTYFSALLRDEEGASAVEYGLILGLIAVVIIVALGLIGTNVEGYYCDVVVALGGAC